MANADINSNSSAVAKVQASLDQLFKSNIVSGDAYIKFQLTTGVSALFAMTQVQESLIVKAKQITTLPNMPPSAIGAMNSRDHVFCVFDLAQLLGFSTRLNNSRQYQIIVLQTTTEPQVNVGFAVANLQGISRFSQEQIYLSSENIVDNLHDRISGVVQQDENTIPILALDSILSSMNSN